MDKIIAIARAEYIQAVRSKAFIIGLVLMPVLMGGSAAVQVLLKDQVDLEDRGCAIVDPTGELWPVLEAAVERRNEEEAWSTDEDTGERTQARPFFQLELVELEKPADLSSDDPEERPDLGLSRRVDDGEITGFLMIDPTVLDEDPDYSKRLIAYHTDEPTFTELPNWLRGVVNSEIRRRRFDAAELDQELVSKLDRSVPMDTWGLVEMGDDGSIAEAEREHQGKTFGVPFAAMMLMFLLVMTSAPQLMNQVLEEKMQRISEVLVSAVTPFQLMMGKLLGSVGVCLTLAAVYLMGIYWSTHHFGVGDFVPPMAYFWFITMVVFALLMYGSLFSALGSACSELRDAQTMVMPAMILIMVPLFAWNAVLEAPNGSVAQALTYVPTATPMILLIRLLAQPGPPLIEIIAGLTMCVLTTIALVWASGKIFRVGVLAQGQPPSFGKLVGWVFTK